MSPSSDSSSEDEEETKQRLAMASCVMSGADVVKKAAEVPLHKRQKAIASNSAEDGVREPRGSNDAGVRRESERRLTVLLSKTYDIVDGVWSGPGDSTRSKATPCSQLRLFTASSATQLHQPPRLVSEPLMADGSTRAHGDPLACARETDTAADERAARKLAKAERRDKKAKKRRKREEEAAAAAARKGSSDSSSS